MNLQLIPGSLHFKPGLPLSLLLVAETPDHRPLDTNAKVSLTYFNEEFDSIGEDSEDVEVRGGTELITLDPPEDAVAVTIVARTEHAETSLALEAGYSPSGNFIHVEQTGDPMPEVGEDASFKVHSTEEARNFHYEVIARGRVVFSSVTNTPDIAVALTPEMAPSSRLVVYQVLPNNEVAADYIPFEVSASYPMEMGVEFSTDQARPGEAVEVSVTTEGPAKVGLAVVDRSVFILAENRLNLQQVFAELERLYLAPQAEVHLERLPSQVTARGAADTFRESGLMVMSDKSLPEGAQFEDPRFRRNLDDENGDGYGLIIVLIIFGVFLALGILIFAVAIILGLVAVIRRVMAGLSLFIILVIVLVGGALMGCGGEGLEQRDEPVPSQAADTSPSNGSDLAEVERVRQFFPETWLWANLMTDESGNATLPATAPDSITTWNLRAVGVSPEHGFSIANTELTVFQPFFLQVDLPYSAIRGEEFPVKVALYNYLDTPQDFHVELDETTDFTLLDAAVKRVTVQPNQVGSVDFYIRLTEMGSLPIKVTARSRDSADSVIKTLLVEPEGVAEEFVENAILSASDEAGFQIAAPPRAIPGSARTYVTLTGSYLAQTLDGLEDLLQMPYGCGEQNMILFAPNIYVTRYLESSDQLKPEVMAKAEHLMTTGYQRELIYRRNDGSFSAFSQSDDQGSLWLTAFVLKSFAQADGLIYVDEKVLQDAHDWIRSHQRSDGSFEPVGFLHHNELLGGLKGNTALTAYVAIALLEAGDRDGAARALAFLESRLPQIEDSYTMAIVACALSLGGSPRAAVAREQLMGMAISDDTLHWGGLAAVETTGYAILALLQRGDGFNASRAARWLVEQRNSWGGFGSTQDTVVALQALTESAAQDRRDVDMTVELVVGDWRHEAVINQSNADVVQTVGLPDGADLDVFTSGSGNVVVQVVRRFNMPEVEAPSDEMFRVQVDYSAHHVEVDDTIDITAHLTFAPLQRQAADAGMIVLDVAVPTGFAPVAETVMALVEGSPNVKRYEVAGRKVIFYIEDLPAGESLELRFQALAQYPVRAQAVTSQVYSYYKLHWRGETLSSSVTVEGK